jgi:hypothetical protein
MVDKTRLASSLGFSKKEGSVSQKRRSKKGLELRRKTRERNFFRPIVRIKKDCLSFFSYYIINKSYQGKTYL